MNSVLTTVPIEKEQRRSALKRLLGSPLARQVLFFFLVLPLIESVFIGVLCYDINEAEQTARREFHAVKACQEFSAAIESIKFMHSAVYDFKEDMSNRDAVSRFHRWEPEFLNRSRAAIEDLKLVVGFYSKLNLLTQTVKDLDSTAKATMTARPDMVPGRYKTYHRILSDSYSLFEELMEEARKAGAERKIEPPLFGLDPVAVIYAAGFANAVFAIIFALFVELRITGPIGQLAKNCEKLKSGEIINSPKRIRSEIDSLHQSFHEMSLHIAEDKKRRSSYLELLQAVQTAALMKVNAWLETVLSFHCDPQTRRRVDKSRGNISTLIEILRSMTDALSNPASSKVIIQCRECTTQNLVQSASSSVESLLEKRQLLLKVENEETTLYADPVLLGRVLLNFLSNAAKYSPEQGEIFLTAKKVGNDISFRVKDSGPGIPASEQGKLFQKFSQLKAADGIKRAGTGLGLVICKEIVEAHGGQIGCDSEQGKGSTFWFKVPLTVSQHVQDEAKTNNVSKESVVFARLGSIKMQFAAMLTLFVGLQAFLFFDLNATFRQSAEIARKFANERSTALDTQAFYALFLVGNKAAKDRDLERYDLFLQEQMTRVKDLLDRYNERSTIHKQLTEIATRQRYLKRIIAYVRANPDKLATVAFELVKRVETTIDQIEDRIYKIFSLQRSSFTASYEGTKILRTRLLTLLTVAGVADLIIIAGAAFVALRIIERINLLKMKSDDFASGKRIFTSLTGNDELGFLDHRLCEASDAIQQAESEKQELIAVINHDLRAPLSSILSSLEILSQGVYGQLSDEPAKILSMSEHQLQFLLRQINDLLMLEKIDSGTYELAKDRLSLQAVLEESLGAIKSSTNNKNIDFAVSLPMQADEAIVEGDKQLLVRLCTIVLANAISASPSNGLVSMSLKKSQDGLVAEIKDFGPGVAPQLKNQLFDRFRFVDGKPITGLGLPLAYRLCKMHGGSIDLKTEPAGGTVVSIKLPLSV